MNPIKVLALNAPASLSELISKSRARGLEIDFTQMESERFVQEKNREWNNLVLFFIRKGRIAEDIASLAKYHDVCDTATLVIAPTLDSRKIHTLRFINSEFMIMDPFDPDEVLAWIEDKIPRAVDDDGCEIITKEIESPLGSWHIDISAGRITLDGALPTFFGYEKGRNVISFDEFKSKFPPSVYERLLPLFRCSGFDCRRTVQVDLDLTHPDGGDVRLTFRGRRTCDSQGDVHRLEGIAFDRYQGQDLDTRIKERDRIMRWLMENGKDLVITADTEGIITYLNPAMELFLLQHREVFFNHSLQDIIGPQYSTSRIKEILSKPDISSKVVRQYHGRKPAWVEWTLNVIPSGEGSVLLCIGRDVTEEKQAQNELRRMYDSFSIFMLNAPGVLFRCRADKSFTMVQISDEIENMLGYPASDFINNSVREFASVMHPEDVHLANEMVRRAVVNETDILYRYRLIAKDGSMIWVQENSKLVTGDDGILYVFGIITDVTELYLIEKAHEDSVNRYESLFNNMQTGFAEQKLIFNDEGEVIDLEYVDINPAFERETGLPRSVIGQSLKRVMPNFEDFWYNSFIEVGLTGKPQKKTNYVKDVDRWFDVFMFSPGEGRTAQIFLDISETMRLTSRIVESEEKYRELFDTMPMAFALCELTEVEGDDGINVLEMNPAMRSLAKRTFVKNSNIPLKEAWMDRWRTILRLNQPMQFEDILEDSNIWVQVISFPVENSRFAVFMEDITDRVSIEKNLKSALDEKELVLHELNHRVGNNLQMMISMLQMQMLNMRGKAGVEALMKTQNRLTSMARAYQHIYSTGPGEAIELGGFMRSLADDILENMATSGKFSFSVNDLSINVTLESLVYISFIVNELISNSALHSLQGRNSAHIDVEISMVNEKLQITYRDDGPGIKDLESLRRNSKSIGMRMVITMVERQLNGKVALLQGPWGLELEIGNLRRQSWTSIL